MRGAGGRSGGGKLDFICTRIRHRAMNFVLLMSQKSLYLSVHSSEYCILFGKGCDVEREQTLVAIKQLHLESIFHTPTLFYMFLPHQRWPMRRAGCENRHKPPCLFTQPSGEDTVLPCRD